MTRHIDLRWNALSCPGHQTLDESGPLHGERDGKTAKCTQLGVGHRKTHDRLGKLTTTLPLAGSDLNLA